MVPGTDNERESVLHGWDRGIVDSHSLCFYDCCWGGVNITAPCRVWGGDGDGRGDGVGWGSMGWGGEN